MVERYEDRGRLVVCSRLMGTTVKLDVRDVGRSGGLKVSEKKARG